MKEMKYYFFKKTFVLIGHVFSDIRLQRQKERNRTPKIWLVVSRLYFCSDPHFSREGGTIYSTGVFFCSVNFGRSIYSS